MTHQSWISLLLSLDRPEYAKQPEALLTDLLWRSAGSSLSKQVKTSRDSRIRRLIPRRNREGKTEQEETIPIAASYDLAELVMTPSGIPNPTLAALESILAPKARGDKSLACVPVCPDVVVLQTLHGLVNKKQPPNLAEIIETMGWLGGARWQGQVAELLLTALGQPFPGQDSFTGFTEELYTLIANHTWAMLVARYPEVSNEVPAQWSRVQPESHGTTVSETSLLGSCSQSTPFHWFWTKWETLCNPENGWHDALPARRFVDWAMCLLRTGLSFAYLWEARFFVNLHAYLAEQLPDTSETVHKTTAISTLKDMLTNGVALAVIESSRIPATQKHAWPSLSNLLSQGHAARRRLIDYFGDPTAISLPIDEDIVATVEKWVSALPERDVKKLGSPIPPGGAPADNVKEFVRYLLRPRSSDDDRSDQADFYYLACTNSKHFWFQPGPEWLVVVTSLLCIKPGGHCTLGMLLDDLRALGIRVERRVLVHMLEEAGLSSDSPDADNALIIQAGF